jgi:hypothetical protein
MQSNCLRLTGKKLLVSLGVISAPGPSVSRPCGRPRWRQRRRRSQRCSKVPQPALASGLPQFGAAARRTVRRANDRDPNQLSLGF